MSGLSSSSSGLGTMCLGLGRERGQNRVVKIGKVRVKSVRWASWASPVFLLFAGWRIVNLVDRGTLVLPACRGRNPRGGSWKFDTALVVIGRRTLEDKWRSSTLDARRKNSYTEWQWGLISDETMRESNRRRKKTAFLFDAEFTGGG